jgi:hypothetical protein
LAGGRVSANKRLILLVTKNQLLRPTAPNWACVALLIETCKLLRRRTAGMTKPGIL